jgi:hypothetical protein
MFYQTLLRYFLPRQNIRQEALFSTYFPSHHGVLGVKTERQKEHFRNTPINLIKLYHDGVKHIRNNVIVSSSVKHRARDENVLPRKK